MLRYHNQAARDAEVVYRRVQQLLHQLNQLDDTISEADVKQFCKHAANLAVVRGSSIADEYDLRSRSASNIGGLQINIIVQIGCGCLII